MPVDLDELERLHKALSPKPWKSDDPAIFIRGEDNKAVPVPFIAAIKNACDDGLLERLRTAERERDEADRKAGAAERKLEHLEDRQRKADAWMRERKAEIGISENAPFDDAWATLASERAALKAENERLREAIRAKGGTEHAPTEDAYLAVCRARDKWQERAEAAEARLATALETTNG